MPYIYDMNDCYERGEIELEVPGWKGENSKNLIIEYGFSNINGHIYLIWHLKGIEHYFRISKYEMEYYKISDLKKHFIETLTFFREDFLEWLTDISFDNNNPSWKYEYIELFKKYVVIS